MKVENGRDKETILQGPGSCFSSTTVYKRGLAFCYTLSIAHTANIYPHMLDWIYNLHTIMGPFLFKLLEVALQQHQGTYHNFSIETTTPQLQHGQGTYSRRPPGWLSLPTPSHSIPERHSARVHNYFYLVPKPQTIFHEAFNIHSKGEEVSLVLPPEPPCPNRSLWTVSLHTLAGGRQDINSSKKLSSHPTTCHMASHY